MPVTVIEDNTAAFYKALAALTGSEVLIGIPAEGAERQADDGDPEPLTNAEIGLIMEYGAPEANIPERPTLIPGVEGIRDAAAARLRKSAQAALDGDLAQVDRGLHAVGLLGQNAVRTKIAEGPPPPLSPRTLRKRRARGRTSEKPLNDTGQFLRSVTYVVRAKGSR